MIHITGIIPARYASTRFPGKPLAMIGDQTMIQRVYGQATKCSQLQCVVVATDDERIYDHVISFGGQCMMTKASHPSGTDRCAEAVLKLKQATDVVINIQGDEPFIDPSQIAALIKCFDSADTQIATLIKKINTTEELVNANIPKVVVDKAGNALYFSRTPIPFLRGEAPAQWLTRHTFYKHIGMYGYRATVLSALTQLPTSALEEAEALEQLRWLENGFAIQTAITDTDTISVDTPDDLLKTIKNL